MLVEGFARKLESHASVERLKTLIITNGLPQTDMALFGIKCPYCGKSDRIHKLEPPERLPANFGVEDAVQYGDLWRRLNPEAGSLGVCKFCLNPLQLHLHAGEATVLDGP
jgi:hypothetical protein